MRVQRSQTRRLTRLKVKEDEGKTKEKGDDKGGREERKIETKKNTLRVTRSRNKRGTNSVEKESSETLSEIDETIKKRIKIKKSKNRKNKESNDNDLIEENIETKSIVVANEINNKKGNQAESDSQTPLKRKRKKISKKKKLIELNVNNNVDDSVAKNQGQIKNDQEQKNNDNELEKRKDNKLNKRNENLINIEKRQGLKETSEKIKQNIERLSDITLTPSKHYLDKFRSGPLKKRLTITTNKVTKKKTQRKSTGSEGSNHSESFLKMKKSYHSENKDIRYGESSDILVEDIKLIMNKPEVEVAQKEINSVIPSHVTISKKKKNKDHTQFIHINNVDTGDIRFKETKVNKIKTDTKVDTIGKTTFIDSFVNIKDNKKDVNIGDSSPENNENGSSYILGINKKVKVHDSGVHNYRETKTEKKRKKKKTFASMEKHDNNVTQNKDINHDERGDVSVKESRTEIGLNDTLPSISLQDISSDVQSYVIEKKYCKDTIDDNYSDVNANSNHVNSIVFYSRISHNKEVKGKNEMNEHKGRESDILDDIFGSIKSSHTNSKKNESGEDSVFNSYVIDKSLKKKTNIKEISKRDKKRQKHAIDSIYEYSSNISSSNTVEKTKEKSNRKREEQTHAFEPICEDSFFNLSSDNCNQLLRMTEQKIKEKGKKKKKEKDICKKKSKEKRRVLIPPIYEDPPVIPEISPPVSNEKNIQVDNFHQIDTTRDNNYDEIHIKQKETKKNEKIHTEKFSKSNIKDENAHLNKNDKISSETGIHMSYSNNEKYDDHFSKIEEDFGEGKLEHADFDDSCKVFLSRIPRTFDTKAVQRAIETAFGAGCVHHVVIQKHHQEDTLHSGHRNFGFVVLSTVELYQKALDMGTVKGKLNENSKRNYTMYINPIVRDVYQEQVNHQRVCYLWKEKTCSYGEECQFLHEGVGGCIVKSGKSESKKVKKKKSKKPFKDVCINWRTKGKCRKLKYNKCPYKHDESILEEFQAKQEKKRKIEMDDKDAIRKDDKKKRKKGKRHEPLFITVLGIERTIKVKAVESFFQTCGTIMNVNYEYGIDSSSDGYWTVLFQSPKAVFKACQLDEREWKGKIVKVYKGKLNWKNIKKINEKSQ